MHDTLTRIKRALLADRYQFTEKAQIEMERDRITEQDVVESVLSAYAIYKSIRSATAAGSGSKDMLHVIQSANFEGLAIYTKGKLVRKYREDYFYILISAKRAW